MFPRKTVGWLQQRVQTNYVATLCRAVGPPSSVHHQKLMDDAVACCFRGPFISDDGHLEGHYPAYTIVTYERNEY